MEAILSASTCTHLRQLVERDVLLPCATPGCSAGTTEEVIRVRRSEETAGHIDQAVLVRETVWHREQQNGKWKWTRERS